MIQASAETHTSTASRADRSVRVMYVIGSLDIGGTQKHVLELLRGLDRRRFEPRVVVFRRGGFFYEEAVKLGIPVDSLEVHSMASLFGRFLTFLRLIRRHRPDVLHVFLFHSSLYGCLARLVPFGPKPKVILSKRSLELDLETDRYLVYRFLLMKVPHLITAVSPPVVERCLELRAAPTRVRLIRNGIGCPTRAGQGRLRTLIGADEPCLLVGSVGSLTARKQHQLLIRAFARVVEARRDARLVILGEGPLRPQLLAEIRRLHLESAVFLPGAVAPATDYLGDLRVFVLPSSEEGTSNALLEAMSLGVPVVASRIPSNELLVRDGRSGLLVDPTDEGAFADAIVRLLKDQEYASALAREAAQRVRDEYGLEQMIRENERAYTELALAGAR